MGGAQAKKPAFAKGPPLKDSGLQNLGQILIRAAKGDGGLVHLDTAGTEHRLVYDTLLDASQRVLGGLNTAGIGQGDRVILQTREVGNTLLMLWACFLGGIVAVPMAPPPVIEDGAASLRKLHAVWSMLGRPFVVTDSDITAALGVHAAAAAWDGFRILAADALREGAPPSRLPQVQPGDMAMMPLTSGSTGLPKAVQLTHANILAMVSGTIQANRFDSADVTLNWMPLDHPGANVFLGVMPAMLGGWQVHAPTNYILTDPLRWLALIDRHRASVSWAPNFAFSLIGRSAARLQGMKLDLSCMTFLVSAGEQVAASTSATFLELLESYGLPETALRPAFGMAESCSGITWSPGLTREALADGPTHVSLGPPIPGAAIRITDDDERGDDDGGDNDRIVNEGEIGHLELRGPSVTCGYFENPEANADALKPDGWFATGDLACIKNGALFITGRKKQIIIINGLNVPVHDIEAAAEEVEGVAASFTAAFSIWDAARGTEVLVMLFSPVDANPAGWEELGRRIRQHLTRRTGLAPAFLIPIAAADIPKTSIGKIQRLELKRRFERGAYRDRVLADTPHRAAAPSRKAQGDQDIIIGDIWKAVLDLPDVGADESFFELGGHSLLLIQVHGRLREHFPALELTDLFKYPTIRTLANFLRAPDHAMAAPATTRRRQAAAENEIAVIGLACRFPGADNMAEFWDNLRQGKESIDRFTVDELVAAGFDRHTVSDPNYVRASPVVKDAAGFDAAFFGFSAREAELMDPQQRLFLACAWETLEDAGYDPFLYPDPIGVFAGASMNTYFTNNVHANRHKLDPRDRLDVFTLDSMGGFQAMVANDKDYIATRTSYKLDLRGPSLNLQTACSTGLVVVHAAVQSLLSGECTMALAGAAAVQSPQAAGHLWQDGMLVSSDGHCRAFDAEASGTIFGSGVGAVLLKPLKAALADGDHVYAVIKGTAVNNDGGVKVGFMAPSGAGETRVVREALAAAAVPPETITFLEAHGTGTALGDPIEVSSLAAALHTPDAPRNFCALGSVKTNVGHLQIASGIVGFIKTVLALHHREIPPVLHFNRPNPAIDLDNSPFYINTSLVPWSPATGTPRRAGVNSLGIGGTNAHVILEEAPAIALAPRENDRPLHLLTLSARTKTALAALIQSYQRFLADHPDVDPADLCFTANSGRRAFEYRHALVFKDIQDLRGGLKRAAETTADLLSAASRVKVVFRFGDHATPGQGRALFDTSPPFRAMLEECDAALTGRSSPSLIACLYGEEAWPDNPAFTQAVAASLGIATASLWRGWGVEADAVLGGPAKAWALGTQSLDGLLAQIISGEGDHPIAPDVEHGNALILDMSAPDWPSLLADLGRFHMRGGGVNWRAFDQPYRRQRLSLPTYPFENRRFWLEPAKAAVTRPLESKPHPLLDRRFDSPLLREVFYEGLFQTERMPLLADHRIHDQVVVSGACYLSMLLGVGSRPMGTGLEIRSVTFHHALTVPADGVRVQLALRPDASATDQSTDVTLISIAADGSHRQHVTGTLVPAADKPAAPALSLADCSTACSQPRDLDRHYHHLEERHIVLGREYRWMTALSRGNDATAGQAFCRLQRPATLDESTDAAYGLHPGLIDSCFGLMIAAVDLDVADTFLPSSIESVRFHRRPASTNLWAWGTFKRHADGKGIIGDIHLHEEDGGPVLDLIGFVGRTARREQIAAETAVPLYHIAWEAVPPSDAKKIPAPGSWVIFADRGGIGAALARHLEARGMPCRQIRAGDQFDAGDPAAYQTVLQSAAMAAGDKGVGVVHLWALDVAAETAPQDARRLGPASALLTAQALIGTDGPSRLYLVTRGAVSSGAAAALQAPLWGLAKVLRLEHPTLPCRTIDLDPLAGAVDAERLANELSLGGQAEIAWRGDMRHRPALRPVTPTTSPAITLDTEASYLVAGGSGALGSALLDWLADRGARHVVVGSRKGNIDTRHAERLARRGITLHLLKADLADAAGFDTAWRKLEPTLPPLRGIVHAAGILDDAPVLGLTAARFDAVARPKMEGAQMLARLAQGRDLDFLVLFSSAASVLGHPGQANYAAANASLDALATELRAQGHNALAISWGPWRDSGMAASDRVAAGFSRLGIRSLAAEEGRQALDAALRTGLPHICAIACDWDRYVAQSGDGNGRADLFRHLVTQGVTTPKETATTGRRTTLPAELAQANPAARQSLIFAFVLDAVTDALSLTGPETIDPHLPLMEQGLDSLAALSVRNTINEGLGRTFPAGMMFEYPTVDDLVLFLARELTPAVALASAGSDDDIDLDALSPEELEALVSRELDLC